jgi:hypothetical protein
VAMQAESLMPERRFPPPWSVELQPNYYVIRDANRQIREYRPLNSTHTSRVGRRPNAARPKWRIVSRLTCS